MPKQTALKVCVRCGNRQARVGVYRAFYTLRRRETARRPQHLEPKNAKRAPQLNGSFPARGYCIECLLSLAQKQGLSEAKIRSLRRKLEGV
jgi:hypothetical protein